MDQLSLTHKYQFRVDALRDQAALERLKNVLRVCFASLGGGQKVEADLALRVVTIASSVPLELEAVKNVLSPHGFQLKQLTDEELVALKAENQSKECEIMCVCVQGMTCQSCELIVERKWKALNGVRKVSVNATTGKAEIMIEGPAPTVAALQEALGESKYVVSQNATPESQSKHPSFWQLVGLFALILLLGKILSSLGLFNANVLIGDGMGFGAIFVLGLVAGSSSCVAVVGGLLLSAAARFNERYASVSAAARMRPFGLFILGRIVGYGLFGGLLGLVGKALSPSPLVTAGLVILAAVYMLKMGLEMLHIAPSWLKRVTPRMPKALASRVMDAEGKTHPLAPIALGAATFFLPCGFTQALQLYALTTGSFTTSALALLAFALGTAPALAALGIASSTLKGKAGQFFYKFSGALVVVLGLWNIQNGLTIAGYPIRLPSTEIAATDSSESNDPNVKIEGEKQTMKMGFNDYGYSPDRFTIKAGLATRWEIDGTNAGGCGSVLVSRDLGVQALLKPGINVIEFTAPKQAGKYLFSCSMGMYRGSITVIN